MFHRGAVAELLPSPGADRLGGILLALTRKELPADRSLYEGDDGFRFNHVLIRDVAYASMPKELRADLHTRLASWLEAQTAQPTGQEEIVGYHYERAYLIRVELGRLSAGLARMLEDHLLGRASRRALDRGEFAAAAAQLERACRLLAVEPAERASSLPDLGRALRGAGALEADAAPCRGDRGREAAQRRGDAAPS